MHPFCLGVSAGPWPSENKQIRQERHGSRCTCSRCCGRCCRRGRTHQRTHRCSSCPRDTRSASFISTHSPQALLVRLFPAAEHTPDFVQLLAPYFVEPRRDQAILRRNCRVYERAQHVQLGVHFVLEFYPARASGPVGLNAELQHIHERRRHVLAILEFFGFSHICGAFAHPDHAPNDTLPQL